MCNVELGLVGSGLGFSYGKTKTVMLKSYSELQ